VSPSQGCGSGGVTPGKILKFETQLVQSGAFWQEIDGSPVFHLCERKHCHNARQWYALRCFLNVTEFEMLCRCCGS